MSIEIRAACAEDILALSEIEKNSFTDPWTADGLAAALDDRMGIFLAAFDGDSAVGYIIGSCDGFSGYIEKIAVDENCRRRGIGRLLLESFRKAMPEAAESISLEVRASNEAAVKMYKGFGFEQAGVRKGFYSSPKEDGIVMIYSC